jgi:hypothetical protein
LVGKRAYADQFHGLGCTAEELVLAGWNRHDLHPLDRQPTELASQLSRITQQYLSYPVRSAVQSLLSDTLEAASIRPAPEPPPPPPLEPLRRAGVPVGDEQEFAEAVRDLGDRRRTMLGLVRGDGWEWGD